MYRPIWVSKTTGETLIEGSFTYPTKREAYREALTLLSWRDDVLVSHHYALPRVKEEKS